MPLDAAGERVCRAIESDEFFVFTHSETSGWIEARHGRLMEGFDRLDGYLAEGAADG
jgi:hypothetical protein